MTVPTTVAHPGPSPSPGPGSSAAASRPAATPGADPDVELIGVTKRFGDVTAVDRMDLAIPAGSFTSLLGPSGCGKTTTLRMIAGFEQPTEGEILLAGRPIAGVPPYQRNVNTVFQHYALFPHMDVAQNVGYGLRQRKVVKDEEKRRVAEALELVRLAGYGKRRTWEMSGGQQQRVALARALVNHPTVLLLDEPLGALDLKLRKEMQLELKALQQEVGITFIYVTHDQEEAMTMSDRIAVMNKGHYEQLGDPESLYERPTTRFVAGFLGISNLLPAKVSGGDDGYARASLVDETAIRVPRALVNGSARVNVGVRPEKIRLSEPDAALAAGHNRLTGVVRDASYLGVSTQYQVESTGGTLTVYEQNVERATRAELWARGDKVQMTWSPDHSFVVPADGDDPPIEPSGSEEPAAPSRPA